MLTPHTTIGGNVPIEAYEERQGTNALPRIEPRSNWPNDGPCAAPQMPIKGEPGNQPILEIALLEGRKYLPIVRFIEDDAA